MVAEYRTLQVVVSRTVIDDGTTSPPRVGQEVAWQLELLAHNRYDPVPRANFRAYAIAYPSTAVSRLRQAWPVHLLCGNLRCFWFDAPYGVSGWTDASGLLVHRSSGGMIPSDIEPTIGVVKRLQITEAKVARNAAGTWVPSGSEQRLREVQESPSYFAPERWEVETEAHWYESGLIADLLVKIDGRGLSP